MREMTFTAFRELPDHHKSRVGGQTWAMWVGPDGQANFTPVKLVADHPKRPCSRCGKEQAGKKVWAKHAKKVLCMDCGQVAYFDLGGVVVNKAVA